MSGILFSNERERAVEQDIVRAFGSSIIEFEAVLFQKFLFISSYHSLVTDKMFRRILNDMHAKGYLSPTEFNNKRCWRRQVVLDDLESGDITPEEFEQVFQERSIMPTSGGSSPITKGIVSDSSSVAEAIRQAMISKVYDGVHPTAAAKQDIQLHAQHMRRALSNSPEELREYVRIHVPSLMDEIEQILREKGENVVLLGLRILSTS